ncbi:hypothetical protein [Nitrosomonas sp.]|uniref:hypothetical protein n=1 Tax=Nitrosomonas sp. TaxID=42353 RepID=UPI0025D1F9D9|nr:hypothetical protein [Nitrosomonas sp.]MCC6917010.1 hypothetical protein [Nitrosomonas sp.]
MVRALDLLKKQLLLLLDLNEVNKFHFTLPLLVTGYDVSGCLLAIGGTCTATEKQNRWIDDG